MVELTRLARALDAAPDDHARAALIVRSAVSLISGCERAGFAVDEGDGLFTRVSTDELVSRADDLQRGLCEGPCLDVMLDQDVLVSNDLAQEHRWPRWASRVHAELGVGLMIWLLVHTGNRAYGGLRLYADRRNAFDGDDVAVAQTLAAQLAMIMAARRQIDQLGVAMQTRTIIGQAQGILMQRLDISADQAFDYLRRVSSESNQKLAAVAFEIARTRQLPSHPRTAFVASQLDSTPNRCSPTLSGTV